MPAIAFKMRSRIQINTFLKNLLDVKIVDSNFENFVMPKAMKDLYLATTADMILRKRVLTPRVRTGFLLRNIAWNSSKQSNGMYIGNLFVKSVVAYSRLHELGGIIKKKVKVKNRSKSKNIAMAVYPRRGYLIAPAQEYSTRLIGFYINQMLKNLSTGQVYFS